LNKNVIRPEFNVMTI